MEAARPGEGKEEATTISEAREPGGEVHQPPPTSRCHRPFVMDDLYRGVL